MRPKPLTILDELKAADPEFFATFIAPNEEFYQGFDAFPLSELEDSSAFPDEDELIKHRFLNRGGGCLFVGPTGIGKSSFLMQLALSFAANLPCFGLVPTRPLRTLIIQAENDRRDLAEMRDGVVAGLGWPKPVIAAAQKNILISCENSRTGAQFAAYVAGLTNQYPGIDLVVADPLFAYLGGDAMKQADVSQFLRNQINPVLRKSGVGFILVHHVNKPPSGGVVRPEWQAGDFAYLGSGSAEFANWARAVLALRNIGSDSVFELLAAKRGKRLRWVDTYGKPTCSQKIAHSTTGICWREPSPAEITAEGDTSQQDWIQVAVSIVTEAGGEMQQSDLIKALNEEGAGRTQAFGYVRKSIALGFLRSTTGARNTKTLTATGKWAVFTGGKS